MSLICVKSYFYLLDEAMEAIDILSTDTKQVQTIQALAGEICKISASTIVLSIEAGLGNDTIPMLTMQASLQAQIKDWSGQVIRFVLLLSKCLFLHPLNGFLYFS